MAFREKDTEFFFGRETFVNSLVQVVNQQPLVVVIGSSGGGKSSVVLAGLIPELREEGSWLIESFRPNKQPFYELAAALIGQLEPELGKTDKNIKAKELAKSIHKYGFTADVSAILKHNPGKRLLLVVDQFEELYTGCVDTVQQQFVDALLAALESASHAVTLVLTLRADFYSYVVNYPPLGEALNKYPAQNLTLMEVEEMRAAIELPAEKMRVKLEEKLTQRILDDVKQEPGNLSLLEFALTQLWEKQSRGQLTHHAYSQIGGVTKALSNHAEAVYGKLSEGDQKQAQRIFLQLVRPGEGTEDTRRVATRGEVGEECWELIRHTDGLADARLVVTGRNEATGEETVEVVHEALIREWGLLRQWIDENRKKLIQKREIEDAAKKWGDRGKAKDYLLGGKVLTEAKVFQKQEVVNLKLSDLAKEFIQTSLKHKLINHILSGFIFFVLVGVAGLGWWQVDLQRRQVDLQRRQVDLQKQRAETLDQQLAAIRTVVEGQKTSKVSAEEQLKQIASQILIKKTTQIYKEVTTLQEAEAVALINKWLQAKRSIFAPPYDRLIAAELFTGERYRAVIAAQDWLQHNQAYYRYKKQKINTIKNFIKNQKSAVIDVQITEDTELYVNGTLDLTGTSFNSATGTYRYSLNFVNGQWKIADTQTIVRVGAKPGGTL